MSSQCLYLPGVKELQVRSLLIFEENLLIFSKKKGHKIFQRISVRGKFKNPEVVKGKIYKYSLKKRSSHLNSGKVQGKFIICS